MSGSGKGVDVPDVFFTLPAALAENAQAWLDGAGETVPTRDASTVMLLRDAGTPGDLEVFVLRRAASMAFAPSAYVFPGGGVDSRDADESLPWIGPPPAVWARRLAASEPQARELVVAAARELFEECGVLLAGSDADSVVADLTGPEWDQARPRLVNRELSFAEFLLEKGLALRTDLLRAVDHWITPEFEPRRYDTRFFAAALPAGQVPDDDCTEAEHVRWVRPADLLAEFRAGEAVLLPPTEVCLARLTHDAGVGNAGQDDGGKGGGGKGGGGKDGGGPEPAGNSWDGSVRGFLAEMNSPSPLPVVLPEPVRTKTGVELVRRWVPAGEPS